MLQIPLVLLAHQPPEPGVHVPASELHPGQQRHAVGAPLPQRLRAAGRGRLLAHGQQRPVAGVARDPPGEDHHLPVAVRLADELGAVCQGLSGRWVGPGGG